ncbi:hypothetical protein [Streptomyces indicus]|uniref:Uncharacterized protein n=1 Tax=Streptomyces indicus TaxID=417292 RepID=A0A1G8UQN3_9ACTN|nr:hypothetical protein [Streptomyces indicus]SDJ55974.1 hypothetical protein SAMN05421806_101997 [Streptomyces indicus]
MKPRLFLIIGAVALAVVWTVMARAWSDKGCSPGQGYALVLTKVGAPDDHEGCQQGLEGPEFTSAYVG